ncbi:MAG: phosphate ABC transporter substrate-binding protein [bacterium]|nr:phosphate ABC transporter substrate-binding protein [bacterium]
MKGMKKVAVMAMLWSTVSYVSRAEQIVVDGSTTVGPIAKAFAEYLMRQHPGLQITVSESGSGNGAKSLINGTCHVATMSRPMRPAELKAAAVKGVNPVEHVIAMDGLPVLVHPSNPIKNLTLTQLRDIYFGRIGNWKWLGGPNLKIVRISRDTNSGTYECFNEMVMNRTRMAGDVEYVGSNGAVRQRVQSTPGAIGYAGLGFVDKTVKAVAINGIAPSAETVLDRSYPLSRPLYMYTNGEPATNTLLHKFIYFCNTPEGKQIISSIGFVPLP